MSIKPDLDIQAAPVSLIELLKTRKFRVPDLQRDYVWKDENVRQLLADLIDHCKNHEVTKNNQLLEKPKTYFLGSMVACKPEKGEQLLEIIDGQQRLTTIACISAVLKEYLEKFIDSGDARLRGCIMQVSELNKDWSGGEWVLKLTLFDSNINKFFKDCILTDKQQQRNEYFENDDMAKALLKKRNLPAGRIKKAIEIADEYIKLFLDETNNQREKIDKLISLAYVFCECVIVLLIESRDYATVYNLFEGLNCRGMPLTSADLVKNVMLKKCLQLDDKQNVIEEWSEINNDIAHFDRLYMPDFLHVSYLSRYDFIKSKKLFNSIKEMLISISPTKISNDLKSDAKTLSLFRNPDEIRILNADTKEAVKDLKDILGLNLSYIGLLASYRTFKENKTKLNSLIHLIVNFCFRYMKVQGGDVATLATTMNTLAKNVRDNMSLVEISNLLKKYSPDEMFVEKFKTFSQSSADIGYYIVYKIEKLRLTGTMPLPHGDESHLEHIMPKKPRASFWPEAASRKENEPDYYRNLIWRIGNLLPLPAEINSSIQDKSIQEKISNNRRKDYTHTDLASPKEVESFLIEGSWNETSIKNRQIKLAERFALKAWPLDA